jgi:hypothetical protein
VKDLLTVQERADFFEIKARLYRADLCKDLPDSEYKRLYKKASKVLLVAVDRELERREGLLK